MIGLEIHNLLLLCLSMAHFAASYRDKNTYPKIHDIISFKRPAELPGNVDIGSEITIDIEKLDIQKLKKNDTAFRNQIMGELGGDILLKTKNARRLAFHGNYPDYMKAYELQYRTKMADCMLQLIYMARSKIKSFVALGYIKQDSSEYRVGFVIRKLQELYSRALRYYTVMVTWQKTGGVWNWESTSMLSLHHKVVMAHYDFDRYYYIQMKLHERLEIIEGNPIHSTADPVPVESTTRR